MDKNRARAQQNPAVVNEQDRKHALEVGQRLLEYEICRHGLNPKVYLQSSILLEVATKLGAGTTDNLLMQIGNGKQSPPRLQVC